MSQRLITNRLISAALIKRGLVPDNCRLVDVQIGVDGAAVIRYEKFVTADELTLIGEALQEAAKNAL